MVVFEIKLEKETYVFTTVIDKLAAFIPYFRTKQTERKSDDGDETTIQPATSAIKSTARKLATTKKEVEADNTPIDKSIDIIYVLVPKYSNHNCQNKTMEKLERQCTVWKGDLYYITPEGLQSFCGFFGQLIPHVGEKESKSPAKRKNTTSTKRKNTTTQSKFS